MDLYAWRNDVQALLNEIDEELLGYPPGENCVYAPANEEKLGRLSSLTTSPHLSELTSFYRLMNGACFSDVHNGFFILPIDRILNWAHLEVPREISGKKDGKIVSFGSDGGGEGFALKEGSGEVLKLPPSGVTDSVYDNTEGRAHTLAPDFNAFLKRVLDDVEAFVKGKPGWKYMV